LKKTKIYKLKLPVSVQVSKKKKFNLNLNQYRNTHYRLLCDSKRLYSDIVKEAILQQWGKKLPTFNHPEITYTIYHNTKRKFDLSNVCSIVDKYFCDCLTSLNIIEDDDYNYITSINYRYGGLDKEASDPYCIVEITETKQ